MKGFNTVTRSCVTDKSRLDGPITSLSICVIDERAKLGKQPVVWELSDTLLASQVYC